jgi:hypothetical protein
MTSSNDNSLPADSARILPIVGKVDPRGVIVLFASGSRPPPGDRATVIDLPDDPREA